MGVDDEDDDGKLRDFSGDRLKLSRRRGAVPKMGCSGDFPSCLFSGWGGGAFKKKKNQISITDIEEWDWQLLLF